jgi:hypothetical protein
MKSAFKFICVLAIALSGIGLAKAQSSLKDDKATKQTEIKDLIQNKDYVFEATTITPSDSSSNHHRYVAISKDTLITRLPGGSAEPIKLSSTNYSYTATQSKNGSWYILIKPGANADNVKQLKLDITPNGSATLLVVKTDKKSITYNGYIKQEDY